MLSTCLHLITTLRHRERCRLHHLFKAACKPLQGMQCLYMRGDAAHSCPHVGCAWGQQAPAIPLLPVELKGAAELARKH